MEDVLSQYRAEHEDWIRGDRDPGHISSKMMILGFPGPGFSCHRYSLRAF
jgi:hypothetical protein